MSHLGKKQIQYPSLLQEKIEKNRITIASTVRSTEPLSFPKQTTLLFSEKDNEVRLTINNYKSSYWGLFRRLLQSKAEELSFLFKKKLILVGLGFRFILINRNLLAVKIGRAHQYYVSIPNTLTVRVMQKSTQLLVEGKNLQEVASWVARVKAIKTPDVYKGKGIREEHEVVTLKATQK